MDQATELLAYFERKQKEVKFVDSINKIYAAYDMRTIASDVNDWARTRMLIRFFIRVAHNKSFDEFKRHYNEYLEDMDYTLTQARIDQETIESTLKGYIE